MPVSTPPLVSAVIPAYNAEKFIGRTLTTVLAQSYRNVEVLVVDDGSTDRTAEIISSFARSDNRVILLQKANGGVASARNLGIEHSKGEFIAPCDSDDIWCPDKLIEQTECLLQADKSVGLVYCWSKIIDEEGRPIVDIAHRYEGRVFAELLYSNFLGNGSCALIRRECFDNVGRYNGDTTPCEEWDLYLRIAEHYEYRVVPKVLVGYREVLTSLSSNPLRMERAFTAFMTGVRQRHPNLPPSIPRLAESYFYFYLSGKSNKQLHYFTTLRYLLKSLAADPMRLLSSEFFGTLLKAVIRLLAMPISAATKQDDRAWRELKQRFMRKLGSSRPMSVASAETTPPPPLQRSLRWFDRIHNRRMRRFKEITATIVGKEIFSA